VNQLTVWRASRTQVSVCDRPVPAVAA